MDNASVMDYIMRLGPTGVSLLVAWYFYNEKNKSDAEKDTKFIAALDKFAEKFEGIADRQNKTLADIDRAHTANSKEMNGVLLGIVGKHEAYFGRMDIRIDGVEEKITSLDHKFDSVLARTQMLSSSKPGKSPGGDFRPTGA